MTATLVGMIALAAGGGLMALAGILRLRLTRHPAYAWAPLALFAGAALAAYLDGMADLTWAMLGLTGAWLVLMGHSVWRLMLRMQASLQARPRIAWALLLVAAPSLSWCWAEMAAPETPPFDLPALVAVNTREVEPSPCRTDAGRIIKVHVPEREATAEEVAAIEAETAGANLLHMGPAGAYCNCHGWVFTGGRYWLRGEDVPDILQDNGYSPVSAPQPGDLIVYRNGKDISHTGIVRAADQFGVLIESKWGKRGRFIHAPEYQDYGSDFVYYRSSRAGHLLFGVESGSTPLTPVSTSRPGVTQ